MLYTTVDSAGPTITTTHKVLYSSIDGDEFKENLNASKPSDQSKGLDGNIGCRGKNLYMVLKGFPNVVT